MAHLSETYSRRGILSRNTGYRADCRNHLQGTNIYNNPVSILKGIMSRDAAVKHKSSLIGGLTQQQRVPLYFFNYLNPNLKKLNFELAIIPYLNQAHHILPCEVFYDKKWTAKHLKIVLMSEYDINNPKNIVMLPQCYGKTYCCDYHNLPDHSKGHQTYNDRVVDECDPIYDLVEEALEEKDCQKRKDIRKQIYDKLKQIETNNFNFLASLGATSMR